MTTVRLTAPDISCAKCKENIERDLGGTEGVRRVEVDVAPKLVTVEIDETVIDTRRLRQLMDEIGYPASS